MKTMMKTSLAVVAGVLLGSCATAVLLQIKIGAVMEKLYSVSIYDQARIAAALETGHQQEVLARLSEELANATVTLGPSPRGEFGRNALWMIRTFFEVSGKPAPGKAQSVLAALSFEPPRICQIERQKILRRNAKHSVEPGKF